MALDWNDVIGEKTLDNGGFIGDIMTVARAHIDASVSANRLTQAQAGEVYAAMIQSAIQTGVKYSIDEETIKLSLITSTLSKG